MRKYVLFLLPVAILMYSCTQQPARKNGIGEDKLPATIYTIDLSRDTLLRTAQGAFLNIPQGAIDADSASIIQLEIKEAYSMADMLRGGLITRSDGQPLSSGGMIYINVAGGATVRLKKAIVVSIPTDRLQEGMQVFKGNKDSKGVINWTNPVPLTDSRESKAIAEGKTIFISNCASCHSMGNSITGPALAFLPEKRNRQWLVNFIRDNRSMLVSGDPYSRCLFEHYNKTAMPLYPNLDDGAMNRLFRYIDNESKGLDRSTVRDYKSAFDSCILYNRLKDSLQGIRRALISGNGAQVELKRVDPAGTSTVVEGPAGPGRALPPDRVEPVTHSAVYYQFRIETVGWYNIDILMKGLPGYEDSELMVRLRGSYKESVTLFLAIPAAKILLEGGPLDSQDTYGFWKKDGRLPLPQGTRAYIIAMGEYKEQVVFGITNFITGRQQSPDLTLSLVTKAQMNEALLGLSMDKLSVTATDSKNAVQIREADKKLAGLERYKPLDWDCGCGMPVQVERDTTDHY
ncbi:c-type cytochrome [Flavitalea flava]